ncbi:hypothetical protein Tco_1302993 [Tanacetum coccineum]
MSFSKEIRDASNLQAHHAKLGLQRTIFNFFCSRLSSGEIGSEWNVNSWMELAEGQRSNIHSGPFSLLDSPDFQKVYMKTILNLSCDPVIDSKPFAVSRVSQQISFY